MFEADVHLNPLHTSIVDICKVFELLVCFFNGMWVYTYTNTLVKLPLLDTKICEVRVT